MPPSFIPVSHNLTGFFVINRETGVSYDIVAQGAYSAKAYSNKATETGAVLFNLAKLVVGLKQKRYRLIPKTLPCTVLYKGRVLTHNDGFTMRPALEH